MINKMAARRVGQKVVDWVKLQQAVPAEVRGDFLAFRGKYESSKARMNAYPEQPQPIDWSFYKSNIAKPGFVEEFEKKFNSLEVPYPKDTASSRLAERQKEIEEQSQEAIKNSKAEAARLKQELHNLQSEKPYEEMTIDEYLADKPELREQIQKDTDNYIWYMPKER